MDRAAMTDGAVSAKTKQLIVLAIAVTRECDGCIASQGLAAARENATREEVAEAMGVAIMMNGGPGTVWGSRGLAAFAEFVDQGSAPSG
jgi:AhpD family alkylhydroperoxidase